MNCKLLREFALAIILLAPLVSLSQTSGSTSPIFIKSVTADEGLARGRYEIKKSMPTGLPRAEKPPKRVPATADKNEIQTSTEATPAVSQGAITDGNNIPFKRQDEPSLKEQAESLFSRNTGRVLNFYRDQIDPDDIRNNRMEIQFSPALVYNGSGANYSYRNYHSFFPALDLAANVWMTPALGLKGRIIFSFGASLKADSTTSSETPAKYEDVDWGLSYRRFFGMSQISNSVEFNLVYSQFKLSTAKDNLFRPGLTSSGLGFRLLSRVPTSSTFSWILGGSFYPRLQHSEERVGLNISSGSPAENTRLGLNLGSEMKFSRESQLIYDLAVSTERNAFDGTASPTDPETSKSPSYVTVTNTFVLFSFGYRWGR